jgi:hypothetical protein
MEMTREDIIRMAREASNNASGLYEESSDLVMLYLYELERFAALIASRVAAAERNSWPAEMEAMERQVNILTDALAQAKAEEREACAKVCDKFPWTPPALQAAIRARGET